MSLSAAWSPESEEVAIAATRSGLLALAAVLRDGKGIVRTAGIVPEYEIALEAIEVDVKLEGRLEVSVNGADLLLRGGKEATDIVASNLETLAREGAHGEHDHYDYYAGHPFLSDEACPLVIELDEPAPE